MDLEHPSHKYFMISGISCLCTIALYYSVEVNAKKLEHCWRGRSDVISRVQMWAYVLGVKARSNIHAVVSLALGTYSLMHGDEMYNDLVWGNSEIACSTCAITVGYMIGDQFINTLYWSELGDFQYLFHHGFTILAYGYVIVTGGLQSFAMVRIMAEGSTLFVTIRILLHRSGQQNTLIYFYNGVAMLISFAVFRMLPIPILLYMLKSVVGTEKYQAQNLFGRVLPFAAHSILDVLNIMWFSKIVRGLYKHVKGFKSKDSLI